MGRRERPIPVSEVRPGLAERQRSRMRLYLILMGVCLVLFVTSWAVVAHYSVAAALVMSAVAAVIPPIAVIVANPIRGD